MASNLGQDKSTTTPGVAACLADVLERRAANLSAATSGFDEHLAQVCLADLTERNLVAALAAFAEDGHAAASVRRALSTWRGFCKWLVREEHLPTNPLEGVKGPKRPGWSSICRMAARLSSRSSK